MTLLLWWNLDLPSRVVRIASGISRAFSGDTETGTTAGTAPMTPFSFKKLDQTREMAKVLFASLAKPQKDAAKDVVEEKNFQQKIDDEESWKSEVLKLLNSINEKTPVTASNQTAEGGTESSSTAPRDDTAEMNTLCVPTSSFPHSSDLGQSPAMRTLRGPGFPRIFPSSNSVAADESHPEFENQQLSDNPFSMHLDSARSHIIAGEDDPEARAATLGMIRLSRTDDETN